MTCKFFLALLATILFSTLLFAQNGLNNYDKRWKKTDSLINQKGLTQSALEEVNTIYASAKKEKNNVQTIKALIYKLSLQQKKEGDVINNIKELDKEISVSTEPAKSILCSIEAETYWNYFQQHRYQFYDRTQTINFIKDDMATWGITDFHKKISELYLASVSPEKLLQQTRLEPFDPIIIKGNVRYLRPTLYDLLAHRALEYFKNDERDITRPAYAFELIDSTVFADKNIFSAYHFTTSDSLSLHFKALLLFRQLIKFHLNDPKPDALLDADIERIEFANQYAVMENKEALYTKALQQITNQYDGNPVAAQAWYLQAQQYSSKASQYNPQEDTSNRYAYILAKNICEHVLQQSQQDSSEGKTNCNNLMNQIMRKELRTQTEKVNIPGQPFRALLSYRNFAQVYWRVIKMDKQIKQNLGEQWTDDYWKKMTLLPVVKTYNQTLPDTKDYQQHAVEIKTDALEPGEYALLASTDKDFNLEKNPLSVQFFYVSNIAYIANGNDYFVLNRETGQPLQGTDVQVWYRYYDAKQNKYLQRKGEQFNTDKNGFFHITPSKKRTDNDFQLEFKREEDHLLMDNESVYYSYDRNENAEDTITNKDRFESSHQKTFFFTDRSIYRPGQTVYFKGITVTKDFESRQYKVLPGFKTKAILYNVNNEKVDSMSVVTNEFGSYHGNFKLPEGQLNGEFKIEDDSTGNEQSFSVEEYKRPKFNVTYDTIKGSYRINDLIKINGIAKAYAGNPLNGAIVKYRVVRKTNFPHPWLYAMKGWHIGRQQEITHGEIKTDDNGKFIIGFTAIPDNIKKELDPVFDYQVIADVTDINGETHSAETIVRVSYKSLNISIDLPSEENLPADSLTYLFIRTENLAGQFESTKVNINIYQLGSPNRLIRERYWQQPDQFVMTKEEYLKYFPYDEYSNETKKESWQRITKVFNIADSSRQGKKIKVQGENFKAGWYLIEAIAKDKYGEEVKDIKYVQLFDSKTGVPASPEYNWITNSSQSVEPGNTATVHIGSSAKDLFIIQQNPGRSRKTNPGAAGEYKFLALSNEKKSIAFPIAESDRGGFEITSAFVKNNRFYTSINAVSVPWTNKDLTINYESYRDKTLPGSEEKWKVKITGYKKDKVTAEILASMYDASLDQFKPHSWTYPPLYLNGIFQTEWKVENNFSAIQSLEKNWNEYAEINFSKNYDRVIHPGNYQRIIIRGVKSSNFVSAAPGGAKQVFDRISNALEGKVAGLQIIGYNEIAKKEIKSGNSYQPEIQIRKNFSETAFFFPDLKTDSSGNVEFSFTMPEALTQWKWMTFAHTKDLAMGYGEKSIITQKQLMVQPNAPRFLREGDRMEFSTKIVNMTDSGLTGQVTLQLIDPITNRSVDSRFSNRMANQYFTATAKQSTSISFPIEILYNYNQPVTYRIIASASSTSPLSSRRGAGGEVSDGEEATLPVLNNRTLVTETLPLNMNSTGTKKFRFEKLLHSGESETLNHQSLIIEFTSNPAWYALQALPYLMEYPYECSEQTFNRFYANALASMIVNSSPRIKEIFERWKNSDTAALLSNLQKNEALKSVLLQETPWVLDAKDESTRKKNIALLFDMLQMNRELESSLSELQNMQLENGGFSWFKDGPDDRYITQYILTGIGHLKKMDALPAALSSKLKIITASAIVYLDNKLKEDYDAWKKINKKLPQQGGVGNIQAQYLYMRSFFSDYPIPGGVFPAINYYRKQAQQSWLQQSRYMQGMIALSLYRTGDVKTANDILASLKQNATLDEENGMYWKDVRSGYYWYESPIETQSLLTEAFSEITRDNKIVNNLKTWLLKQKQTQNWKTTKATADACYALLLQGTSLLTENSEVAITLSDKIIQSKDETTEGGTGYFKKIIPGDSVKPSMGNIIITLPPSPPAGGEQPRVKWGAIYWQYFENLDKITSSAGTKMPLTLIKKIFIEKNTDRGPVLEPVTDNGTIKIGDKIKVRIELRVDRDMEYVHMKDMRAAATEPVNIISKYNWQGGLGYYESTKDASTNFFFNRLPKGTHVFEYPMFVTAAGNFSNGITTIQCMYAPEFNAHSDGIRITITNNK